MVVLLHGIALVSKPKRLQRLPAQSLSGRICSVLAADPRRTARASRQGDWRALRLLGIRPGLLVAVPCRVRVSWLQHYKSAQRRSELSGLF